MVLVVIVVFFFLSLRLFSTIKHHPRTSPTGGKIKSPFQMISLRVIEKTGSITVIQEPSLHTDQHEVRNKTG